jgi:phage-related protein
LRRPRCILRLLYGNKWFAKAENFSESVPSFSGNSRPADTQGCSSCKNGRQLNLEFVHLKVNFDQVKQERKIVFHGIFFTEFYIHQTAKVQEKIDFVLKLIATVDRVSERFLKHMAGTDGLYEVRVECGSNIFRIFCCFDKGNLVILFNAFIKKTQKTPKKEIELAIRLKKEYFNQKERDSKAAEAQKSRSKK